MHSLDSHTPPPGRRRVLVLFVNTVVALIGGGLSAILGAFALRPEPKASGERWIRAGSAADLPERTPAPRVLSVPRTDGWYRERSRETIFLVRESETSVRAMSATCSHLGCQVRWDAAGKKFRCPCHGGVYDVNGKVLAGPPPRPLRSVEARIDAADGSVLVRL
jgi:Rieske Fe-S protein